LDDFLAARFGSAAGVSKSNNELGQDLACGLRTSENGYLTTKMVLTAIIGISHVFLTTSAILPFPPIFAVNRPGHCLRYDQRHEGIFRSMSMRNFFRYLLVVSVLAIGYYGASQHRLTDELPEMVEGIQADPPVQTTTATEDSPLISSKDRPTPLAALFDKDRPLMTKAQVDPRATVKNPAEIARPPAETPPNDVAEDSREPKPPRPKRRPQNEKPDDTSQVLPKPSVSKNSFVGGFQGNNNTVISSSEQDTPTEVSRPVDQPRNVPMLASRQSESPTFSLPPLASRPGDRFVVSDPPESGPIEDVMDDEDNFPEKGASKKLLEQRHQPPNDSDEMTSGHQAGSRSSSPGTHTIEAGDTLSKLAERYLGDRQKSGLIYQANSDVLFDPRLLPIGVELRIPTRIEFDDSEDRQTKRTSGPEQRDDPLDDLFKEPNRSREPTRFDQPTGVDQPPDAEEPGSDLEPIPPQALPSFQMNAWRYSGR
jgi:nucleoid-associated protein YgaU